MQALAAFAAALLALHLAGRILGRWRERRAPDLAAWAASLASYALASGALTWGAAAGWSEAPFRLYYLFGGLLTAPLLGVGSLLRWGWRRAVPVALVYAGLAVGVAAAMPLHGVLSGTAVPDARDHLDVFPARILAVAGNAAGTLAVVGVALLTFRRRPVGNAFILAGVAVAATGSAFAGLGTASAAASLALAVALLYAGFVVSR